jgi:hypothetical protein
MHVVTLPQLQHPRPIEQNVHASRRCWWSRTIASSYGSQQQPQQHKQQPDYWYEQHGPQQLQQTLQLPSWRFQRLVQQEPSLLAFQGDTLQVTLQALCDALHANHKTVVSIVEQRPALLLQPQEPVQVLQQLSQVLGRSTQQTAFLLAPHPQLLALQPQQLQQHMQDLCGVMHWPCSNQQQIAAAGAAGAAHGQQAAGPQHST